jgi:hypothetical protein
MLPRWADWRLGHLGWRGDCSVEHDRNELRGLIEQLGQAGLFKTELVDRHERSWIGRAELERETGAWYNTSRLLSAIGTSNRSSTDGRPRRDRRGRGGPQLAGSFGDGSPLPSVPSTC